MATTATTQEGRAVAARVGINIRELRMKLSLTQAQLAAPEFSISYISAIEHGNLRPSLKALTILARRLDVPLTFLLESNPAGATDTRPVGFSTAGSSPDVKVDVELLEASVLVEQRRFVEAAAVLRPIEPERITKEQAYRLFLLRGQVHLGLSENQEAVDDLLQALTQAEGMGVVEHAERARNLLGKAYFFLPDYTLALEHHLQSAHALETQRITDPAFTLDVYGNLANDYDQIGDHGRATEYHRKALAAFEGVRRDSKSFAGRYLELGQSYKAAGKVAMAHERLLRSLAIYKMRDEQRTVGTVHLHLGKTLEKQGDLEGAQREFLEAIAIEEELGDDLVASACHTSLAELLIKRGNMAEAEQEAQMALSTAERSGDMQARGLALIALAQLKHNAQDYRGADNLFFQALDLLEHSNAHELAGASYARYATQLESRGELQRSLEAFRKAYQHVSHSNSSAIE